MLKCVAIDDEPIALSIIEEYCRRHGGVELSTFTSPVEGMEFVYATHPDVVFLDIELNSHSGLDLARQLPSGTCLIFTTAYSDYALDGFNADAVDFLHKPIFYPRFERAIAKARKWVDASLPSVPTGTISLKIEHKNVVVNTSDILYIEAMDNYVKIYRKVKPMLLTQITMKEMENRLPASEFARVHRSYIVPLKDVEHYTSRLIRLRNLDIAIPIGRKYAPVISLLK